MGILKLQRTTEDVPPQPLPIAEGLNHVSGQMETFNVLVRYRSRREIELFAERNSRKVDGRNVPDMKRWNTAAPDFYIVGFEGCTPSALRSLMLLAEDPPTDAEGHVEYSPELARELWVEVPVPKLADPVWTCAQGILELRELEKKLDSTPSDGS